MSRKPRSPYFETGIKCYIYGDAVLEYAKACDKAAKQYDIDILFIAPYTEIREIRRETDRLIISEYRVENDPDI